MKIFLTNYRAHDADRRTRAGKQLQLQRLRQQQQQGLSERSCGFRGASQWTKSRAVQQSLVPGKTGTLEPTRDTTGDGMASEARSIRKDITAGAGAKQDTSTTRIATNF